MIKTIRLTRVEVRDNGETYAIATMTIDVNERLGEFIEHCRKDLGLSASVIPSGMNFEQAMTQASEFAKNNPRQV